MQDKENVCEPTTRAEQGSVIDGAQGAQEKKEGLADLGKFKDVNALLQAYTSLQAEFTRRSQRLKEYEKEEENRRTEAAALADKVPETVVTADAPTAETEGPSSPEEESVTATDTDKAIASICEASDGTDNMAMNNEKTALRENALEQNTPSLYEQVMANEDVRLKVVGDYLSSIGKSGVSLLKGGKGVLTTPAKKAATISDAGNLALAYLMAQKQ